MTRLYVVVEGQTEEAFVKSVLAPHLDALGVFTIPMVVATKRDRKTRAKKGRGGGHWKHWHNDLCLLSKSQPATDVRITTLFDLYGLPDDFLGLEEACQQHPNTEARAQLLEQAMADAIDDHRFVPYLQRHEFEALVLSALDELEALLDEQSDRDGLRALRRSICNMSPEEINDGAETAPSKRLQCSIPSYRKGTHGPLVTEAAGLQKLRNACPRFDQWIQKLEAGSGRDS